VAWSIPPPLHTNDSFGGVSPTDVTDCDNSSVKNFYPVTGGGGGGPSCEPPPEGCPEDWLWDDVACKCTYSPLILDTLGDGYKLTDAAGGVLFATRPGALQQIAWTTPDGDEAFLVLDRNGNGVIDDGTELFGVATPLYPGGPRAGNGFEALAALERPEYGKSVPDRIIDRFDAQYRNLRLWIDRNHDGVSQPDELLPLPEAGLLALDTRHREVSLHDANGNRFGEVAHAWWRQGRHGIVTRPYYDVWLTGH